MLDNMDIIHIEINLNAEKLNRLRLCSRSVFFLYFIINKE